MLYNQRGKECSYVEVVHSCLFAIQRLKNKS